MWHYVVGAGLLWNLFGPKQEETKPAPANADPYAAHCPVDATLAPDQAACVRACWSRGSKEDLEAFAHQLGTAFPIARSSLLGRAYELSIAASRATQGGGTVVGRVTNPPPAAASAAPTTAPATETPAEDKPAPVPVKRTLTKQEIAAAEGRAAIAASETNGKGRVAVIDVPYEVVDERGDAVG